MPTRGASAKSKNTRSQRSKKVLDAIDGQEKDVLQNPFKKDEPLIIISEKNLEEDPKLTPSIKKVNNNNQQKLQFAPKDRKEGPTEISVDQIQEPCIESQQVQSPPANSLKNSEIKRIIPEESKSENNKRKISIINLDTQNALEYEEEKTQEIMAKQIAQEVNQQIQVITNHQIDLQRPPPKIFEICDIDQATAEYYQEKLNFYENQIAFMNSPDQSLKKLRAKGLLHFQTFVQFPYFAKIKDQISKIKNEFAKIAQESWGKIQGQENVMQSLQEFMVTACLDIIDGSMHTRFQIIKACHQRMMEYAPKQANSESLVPVSQPPISIHLIDQLLCLVAIQGPNRWSVNLENPIISKLVKPELVELLYNQVSQFDQRLTILKQIVQQFEDVKSQRDIEEIEKVQKMGLDAITRRQIMNADKIQMIVWEQSRRKYKEFKEDKEDKSEEKKSEDKKVETEQQPENQSAVNLTTQKQINNFFKTNQPEQPKSPLSNFLTQKPKSPANKQIQPHCDWDICDTSALISHFKAIASQERSCISSFPRFKNIDLHDSYISYHKANWHRALNELNLTPQQPLRPRNPFLMLDLFRYDQDSEEEFNDLNGENLHSEAESDLDEYDQSLLEEGFIVGDLEYDTYSDTSEGYDIRKENANRLREVRRIMTQQKNEVHVQISEFQEQYRAVALGGVVFPLTKPVKESNARFEDIVDKMDEITALVEGSRLSKTECIKLVQEKFNLKKSHIETFFRNCVQKDKMQKDEIKEELKNMSKQKDMTDSQRKQSFMRLSVNSEAIQKNFQMLPSKPIQPNWDPPTVNQISEKREPITVKADENLYNRKRQAQLSTPIMDFKKLVKKADTKLKPQNSESLFGKVQPNLKKTTSLKRITQFPIEVTPPMSSDDELKKCQ